jgi:hypothetical protein
LTLRLELTEEVQPSLLVPFLSMGIMRGDVELEPRTRSNDAEGYRRGPETRLALEVAEGLEEVLNRVEQYRRRRVGWGGDELEEGRRRLHAGLTLGLQQLENAKGIIVTVHVVSSSLALGVSGTAPLGPRSA